LFGPGDGGRPSPGSTVSETAAIIGRSGAQSLPDADTAVAVRASVALASAAKRMPRGLLLGLKNIGFALIAFGIDMGAAGEAGRALTQP
jgi:hypothetical protein